MLNCLEGYLTPGCSSCPDWADGTDPSRGFGCACNFPIMECPHFAKAYREEDKKLYVLERMDSFIKSQMVYFRELSSTKEEPKTYYGDDVLHLSVATKYTLDEAMKVARYMRTTWGDHYKVIRVGAIKEKEK